MIAEKNPTRMRKLSFLEDQEYRRQRDEEAAESKEQIYSPTLIDYIIFGYFCLNCFLLCGPFLNSNAAIKIWKSSDTFVSECSIREDDDTEVSFWCPQQAESARVALILFQSAAAAANLMGGVLVDTFSAAMCMLIAHLMFAGGSYFLQSSGTRGIYAACALQGAAGELLINSVLPMCGLFGDKQHIMLTILTSFSDLSVLVLPIVYTFLAPLSDTAMKHEIFYQALHQVYFYIAMGAAIIGTFLLPIDDDGNLVGTGSSVMATASSFKSINVKPRGSLLRSRFNTINHEEEEDEELKEGDDEELSQLLNQNSENYKKKRNYCFGREPRSLWNLSTRMQLKTPQFFIALLMFCFSTLRNSFYLNNNQQLLEAAGDDGHMTTNFMWLLGLSSLCTPVSWFINDNFSNIFCLFLFTGVSLSVNILSTLNNLKIQWLTLIFFVFARSLTFSTILTYLAGCFGFKRFPIMTVIIGFLGGSFNFCNLLIDDYVKNHLQGDYVTVNNSLMIGLGIISIGCVLIHILFPTINDSSEFTSMRGFSSLQYYQSDNESEYDEDYNKN